MLRRLEWFDRPEFAEGPPEHAHVHATAAAGAARRLPRLRSFVVAAVLVTTPIALAAVSMRAEDTTAPTRSSASAAHAPRTAARGASAPRRTTVARPAPRPAARSVPVVHAKRHPVTRPERATARPRTAQEAKAGGRPAPAVATRHTAKRAAARPARPSATRTTRAAKPVTPIAASLPAFTWPTVPRATAYEFQLFRGPTLVYSKRVTRPLLQLPRTWRHAGRVERLVRGAYRWNVWPIFGSTRADRATVQAKLAVR